MPQGAGLNCRELFAGFIGEGADAGVVQVGRQLALALAFHLIDLLLLPLQVAAVLDVDLRSLAHRQGQIGIGQAVAHQICGVHAGPAQQVGQGDRAFDGCTGFLFHCRGHRIAHLEPHVFEPLFFALHRLEFVLEQLPAAIVDQAKLTAQWRQPAVGVVTPQDQAVFAAAGEHPVGLAQVFAHQIVDHRADVAALAGEMRRLLAADQPGGVDAGNQALGGGFLIARGAIELASAEQAAHALGFQGWLELGGGQVVVINRVRRPQHHGLLQARQAAQQLQLDRLRQAGGEALHIDLWGVAPLRLKEDLVAVLVREAHDLVFDRGAVARAFAVDHTAVDGREVQVVANELMGFGGGAGDVAAHLFATHPGSWVKGEEAIGRIAGLLHQQIEGDAAAVHPGGGSGLKSVGLEAKLLQRFGEPFSGLFTSAAGSHRLMPHPNAAPKEGAGGEDHCISAVDAAEVGADAADELLIAFAGGFQAGHHRFAQGEIGGVLQQLQHLAGIEALVGLGA